MLITIYGINNIGKSTHAKRLVEKLLAEGKKAVYLKYPIYDILPSGDFLNKSVRSEKQEISEEELQMWFALNRMQYQPTLQKLLNEGNYVIAEDYTWTGITWGTLKGADREWLKKINEPLVKEDAAILMYGERQIGAEEDVHIHERNSELLARCQELFLQAAEENDWSKVELQKKVEDTAALMWETLKSHIAND